MNSTVLTTVVSLILGGGFITGIVALVKLRPEGDQILISSAKDVVVIQKGALDDLRKQMDEMEVRFDRQTQTSAAALAECHRERDDLRSELVAERLSNDELRARIEALETEVAQLRTGHPTTPGPAGQPTGESK